MSILASLPMINTRRFVPEDFANRLNHVVTATENYGGTLTNVWEARTTAIQPIEVEPCETPLSTQYDPRIKHEIELLHRRIGNTGARSVSIEAAHVYAYENPLEPELRSDIVRQANAAYALGALLRDNGIGVTYVQFIDNYNAQGGGLAVPKPYDFGPLREALSDTGFQPSVYLQEAEMVPLAHAMMKIMEKQGLVIKKGQVDFEESPGDTHLSHRSIELFNGQQAKLSCAMLDSALTMVKLRFLGDAVVNILPRRAPSLAFGYKNQQFKMRKIVGDHLATRIVPIFNIFTDSDSAPTPVTAGAHHTFRKRSSASEQIPRT